MIKTLVRGSAGDLIERGPFTRAYSTQYVSLMFIVLTFVIGSFVTDRVQSEPETPRIITAKESDMQTNKANPARAPVQAAAIGKMSYHDLFAHGESTLNPDVAGALLTFMRSHDLRARFEISADPIDGSGATAGLENAVARAVTLSQFFEGKGIPFGALDIIALPTPSDIQVRAQFFKEAVHELP
jgi:hypothetical protein